LFINIAVGLTYTHTHTGVVTCGLIQKKRQRSGLVIKSFFVKIFQHLEIMGYAVAASRLANMGMIEEAKQLILQREQAKKAHKELSRLTDRELNDIGINRGDIRRIAYGNLEKI
jgi:uncharacterized protein YjiS (DUF1127 family)